MHQMKTSCPHCQKNNAAAERARKALEAAGYDVDDLRTGIQDLMTDLQHLYDRTEIVLYHDPWSKVQQMAEANYQGEVDGDDPEVEKTCG